MKKLLSPFSVFFIFSSVLIGISCNQVSNTNDKVSVISTLNPKWAKGFAIQTMSDSTKRIILFNLEKMGDTLSVTEWRPKQVERVACLSTTHIAILQKLDQLDVLKGVGFAELVQNTEAKTKIQAGSIINLTTSHDVDAEVVFSVNPQLFFVYPFGGMNYERYKEKNIPCIPISEYLETHPLGRAEWIKVFGALLNEEKKAEEVFNAIEKEYLTLKELAMTRSEKSPSVFTGFYDSGSWFAPPGNSFAAQFILDAGADYIFSDSISSGNIVIPFETMLDRTFNVDFWGKIVFEEGALTQDKIAEDDERLTQLKSFKDGNIFYCNAAETDYHGDAVMQPEIILKDLILVFHPKLLQDHKPVYFKSIHSHI